MVHEKPEGFVKFIILCFTAFFFVCAFALCPISAKEKSLNNEGTSEFSERNIERNEKTGDNTANISQNNQYEYEKPTVEEESYVWLIIKTLIVLGALIGGFYFFYRFVTKKTGTQILGRDVIKILSIVPVGQNKFLQVIDLAGRIMVIGVSDSNINLITEIQDKNEIDRIRLLSSKSSPIQPGGFQEYISKYISRLLGKDNNKKTDANYKIKYEDNEISAPDKMDYLKKQRERLKKINGNNNEI